ncbi:MAG: ABC transporter ATP-binding protein [Halanaerobiales bacterium]|nr:ABC transporter ATP-binding protein [Halanaerobiales bacterium]
MNSLQYPIRIEELTKEYNKIKALKGISFKVKKGEIFGFLGPNGAGKSTALNILIGILKPTSGMSYLFEDNSMDLSKKTRQRLGVVFEENNLYKRLSGRENLQFFARLYNTNNNKVENLLDLFDLSTAGDRLVKNYSKGMKQRLLIARALLNEPQLLILDEPTSGLDPQSVEVIHKSIEDFAAQGKTVLISTHFMEEADRLCDKIAFINKGQIVTITPPAELKSRYGAQIVEVVIKEKNLKIDNMDNIVPERFIREKDGKIVVEIPINELKMGKIIDNLKKDFEILSIHTKEASLHQVFLKLTKQ